MLILVQISIKFLLNQEAYGKIVEIRTNWDYKPNIKAKASCSKNDEFDFDTGFDIADGRLQIKLLQKELQDKIDEL